MWEKYKVYIILLITIIFLFISFNIINTYIDNKVSQKILKVKEESAEEKAELQKRLEADNINERAICDKKIIELKAEIEKAKILLDKIQKQKTYSVMVKKDVQKFIDEVDTLFDLKGKKDEKK